MRQSNRINGHCFIEYIVNKAKHVTQVNRFSLIFRYVLFASGILISFPLLVLLLFLTRTPISPVGIIYLLSYALIVLGMILAPRQSHLSLTCLIVGITIVLAALAIRIIFPPSNKQMNLMTLPSRSGPRLLNRLLNERDIVLFGAQVAPYLGAVSSAETESLAFKFSQAFHEMDIQGVTPLSPFLTTYLNQQSPDEFDVVISEPSTGTHPKAGIIFLHGSGGNFTLQCWLIATVAQHINAITVCPSTGPSGAWWNAKGQSIIEKTFSYLQKRGVERIYLSGLSNGGIGASRLADQFQQDVKGLILISGADPSATMTRLPVLLLHGNHDERIPSSVVEKYASASGANATYYLFEGDHFLLLKQADQVQEVIIEWLSQQELNLQKQ